MLCKIVGGTNVPGNEKSWERKFLGTKGPGNESSQELSFPGNESSQERKGPGTKVPGKFPGTKSLCSGTKVPHRDYSFLGTKGLGHKKSRYPLKQGLKPEAENGNQSTRHTVNSSHRKIVWRVDHRVSRCCDELIILFDLAFVTFKSFAVVGDFEIAHAAMTCRVVYVMCNVSFLSSFHAHK